MTEDVYAAAQGPKRRRPESEMARRNREEIAKRTGWPDGALAECYRIEAEAPGWNVFWASENRAPGFECPIGYHGVLKGARDIDTKETFGVTPDELLEEIRKLQTSAGR